MDAKRLAGKRAVVVGAGQQAGLTTGIGRAIALEFAAHGARLLLVDKVAAAAEATRSMIEERGGKAVVHLADIGDGGSTGTVAERAEAEFGGVDVLVNSVGILGDGTALDTAEDRWDRVLDVNLKGMWLVTKAVLPMMIAQRGGSIVNVSSIGALRGPNLAYGVSKAGVNRLTQSLAASYAKYDIRANAILPGLIETPMAIEGGLLTRTLSREEYVAQRAAAVPMAYKGSSFDVAHAAVFFAADESRYVSGALLPVDGALVASSW